MPRIKSLRARRRIRRVLIAVVTAVAATMIATTTSSASFAATNPLFAKAKVAMTRSASNTGVPKGVKLKRYNGNIVVTKKNTVISGLEVHGTITIKTTGVVIKNSKIVGGKTPSKIALVNNGTKGLSSFTIIRSELVAAYPSPYWNGVFGHNFTLDGVNIHGVVDAVRVVGSHVTVRNSWLHGNLHYAKDPLWNGKPSHDDSVQVEGGGSVLIEGSRLEGARNAGLMINQTKSLSRLGAITLRNNYIQGGACTVNVATAAKAVPITVTTNFFGPTRKLKNCGVIAPQNNATKLVSNVWSSTGMPFKISRGN